jgi:hypothetical protein
MGLHQLTSALRNEQIVRQKVFHDKGIFPGPQPAVELPADKVLVIPESGRVLIRMDDLIEVVQEVIAGKR